MANNAGVWIDHRQATVVLLTDAGQEIKKIKSGLDQSKRPAGTRTKNIPYTPNDFIAEDKRERKADAEHKKFYDEVIACIRGAKRVLILGPGEAKGEFSKHITAKKTRGFVVELETADKMSDLQLGAKAKQHFAKSSNKKSAAPKKTTKKPTKTTAGKLRKKSGK
jgi:stalled ribosome rescue protein Dom34